jgi:hypothetical protein
LFFRDKDHRKPLDASITLHRKIALEVFLTCTPNVLATTLLEDSLWTLIARVKRACLVASLTPMLTLVSFLPKPYLF